MALVVTFGALACAAQPPARARTARPAPAKERRPKRAHARTQESPHRRAPVAPFSPAAKRVLHVGDSTVGSGGGLSEALRRRFEASGATFHAEAIGGISIAQYAKRHRLEHWMKALQPDLVIITLGMNDTEIPHPETLAPTIRRLVDRAKPARCHWIGPPTIKPDTGVVRVLEASVGACTFYDSSKLEIARLRDGIHPSDVGGEAWAKAFWRHLERLDRARPLSDRPDGGASLIDAGHSTDRP